MQGPGSQYIKLTIGMSLLNGLPENLNNLKALAGAYTYFSHLVDKSIKQ